MRNQFGFSFLAASLLAPVAFAQTSDLDAVQVPAAADQEVTVTYKPGSGVKFSGENFSITMGGNIFVDYYFWALDAAPDVSTFAVKEARFYLKGKLYHTNTSFKLMFEGMDTARPVKDAWIQQGLWKNEDGSMGAHIRFGVAKQAFGREWIASSTQREFISQSIAADSFSGVRAGGGTVTLSGKAGEKNSWRLNVGAYNKSVHKGMAGYTGEQEGNVDNELNFAISGDYDMGGLKVGTGQGDLARSEELKFGVGGGLYIGNESTGNNANNPDVETFAYNLNAALATGGIYAQFELFGVDAEQDVPGATKESQMGFSLQGSYTLADMIYVAARFAMVSIDANSNFVGGRGIGTGLGTTEGDQMNISVAAGKYFNGHNNKIQAEITFESVDYEAAAATDVDNIIFALRYAMRI